MKWNCNFPIIIQKKIKYLQVVICLPDDKVANEEVKVEILWDEFVNSWPEVAPPK